jgi:predicted transcriptional regulator of viral defense system
MNALEFFEKHPVFTREEFCKFMISRGTTNSHTQQATLSYHLKKKHIVRIQQSFYAKIPLLARNNFESYSIDPYLIAGRIRRDAVLAYQSAFDFHGVSYSLHHQYLFMTRQPVRAFEFRGEKYISLPFPKVLREQHQENFEVITLERQGMDIQVTSIERTIVDVLDRPKHAGGWEEIWRSAEHIPILNLNKVLEYANLLNNATTIAKLGFFLEQFQQKFDVNESILKSLEARKPGGMHYLERGKREPGTLLSRWNLVVPNSILKREWEEPNENF